MRNNQQFQVLHQRSYIQVAYEKDLIKRLTIYCIICIHTDTLPYSKETSPFKMGTATEKVLKLIQ